MRRSYEESGAPFCAGVRPCPGHRSPSEHPTSSTGPRPVPHRSVEAARSGPVDQIPISCPPDCSRDGSFDAAAGVYGDCPGSLNSALELSGVLAYLTSRHARKGSHPHPCRLPAQQRRPMFRDPAWARSQSCPAGHVPWHICAFGLLNFFEVSYAFGGPAVRCALFARFGRNALTDREVNNGAYAQSFFRRIAPQPFSV
jgi:hypothetical protein